MKNQARVSSQSPAGCRAKSDDYSVNGPVQQNGGAIYNHAVFTVGIPLLFLLLLFIAAAIYTPESECEKIQRPESREACEARTKSVEGPISQLKLRGL